MGRFGLCLAIGLAASTVAGCATLAQSGSDRPETGKSAFGNYLAGRFARSMRDTAAAAAFFKQALAEDPDNPALLRRAFLQLVADGQMREAVDLAKRVLKSDPSDAIAHLVLAAEAMRERRYGAAASQMDDAPKSGFSSLIGPLVAAWAQVGLGDADAALKRLESIAENAAFAPFYRYHVALLEETAGRDEAADAAYRELLERASAGTLRVVEAYGRFLERRKRAPEARALYEDYLKRQPDSPVVSAAMARLERGGPAPEPLIRDPAAGVAEAFYGAAVALSRDDAGEAQEIYLHLALYLRPRFPAAQMLLGDLFENRRRWEQAMAAYEGIERDSPYGDQARIRVAWCLNELDRTDEALARLAALARERPERTEALVALGDVLRGKERFEEAAVEYGRAIARLAQPEERHWTLFYARGIAHERSRQWPRAESDFLRALELKPDQPLVLNYLGYSWVDQGLRLDEARAMIQRAVELRPNDGYIVDSLGWVLYRLGRFDEAVRHLERAVELRPGDPLINDHLGDAYWRVGRQAEARFQWQRALNLKPDAELVPQIRSKLELGLDGAAVAAPGQPQRNGG
jgi:tetratricopeptide (TPR) repeat protein